MSKTILVVEDDKTVGQYVKRGLEEARYQVDLVDDGTAPVAWATQYVDAVNSDATPLAVERSGEARRAVGRRGSHRRRRRRKAGSGVHALPPRRW